jgi:hypothetical protein
MATPIAILSPAERPLGLMPGGDDELEVDVVDVVDDEDRREFGNALTPRVGKGAFVLKVLPGKDVGQLGADGVAVYRERGVPDGISVAHWLCSSVQP